MATNIASISSGATFKTVSTLVSGSVTDSWSGTIPSTYKLILAVGYNNVGNGNVGFSFSGGSAVIDSRMVQVRSTIFTVTSSGTLRYWTSGGSTSIFSLYAAT